MPEGDPITDPAPPVTDPAAGGGSGTTFTQAQVDAFNAETRRKAAEAEQRRVLEALGVQDVDSAKAIIDAAKAADEAAKTELQKAQEENARLKAAADAATAKATNTLVLSKVENALRDAGINPARVEGALLLAPLSEVKVSDNGAVEGVEDVVKAVQAKSPEWFGVPGKTFTAPDVTGGGGNDPVDYRTASPADRARLLSEYNVKPSRAGIAY